MAIGVWLHVTERHEHHHAHDALEHENRAQAPSKMVILLFMLGLILFFYCLKDIAIHVMVFTIGHSKMLLSGVLDGGGDGS